MQPDAAKHNHPIHDVAELFAMVGKVIGISSWMTIDQDRIDRFAAATDDHQWIHTDPQRARTGPYGTTIAHGFLVLSLVVPLTSGFVRLDTATAKVNYGLDRVRFVEPVPVGSRIRASSTLLAVDRTKSGLRTSQRIVVELAGSSRPACVADYLGLITFPGGV